MKFGFCTLETDCTDINTTIKGLIATQLAGFALEQCEFVNVQ